MDFDSRTTTKSPHEIPIDLVPPIDHPVARTPDPAQIANPPAATFTFDLSPRIMEFASVALAILGKSGILWLDVQASSVVLSAAGKSIAFSHDIGIHVPEHASSFGVSAHALASAVARARQDFPRYPLVVTVDCAAGKVFVKPDVAALTGGMPVQSLLIRLDGVASSLDNEDIEAQVRAAERRMPVCQLTGYFERPETPHHAVKATQDPVPFDRRTLRRCLSDARKILLRTKKRGRLQLAGRYLYGGDEDVFFWYDVPSLAACDCIIARQQIAPLVDLLALIPATERCEFVQAGSTHLIQTRRTTIFLPTASDPHPADLPAILAKRPNASFQVNASAFARQLKWLAAGEADNGKFVVFHGTLVVGEQTILQTESLNPDTGGQFNRGADLNVVPNPHLEAVDFLADLGAMQRAVARLDGEATLQVGAKSLYIEGVVKEAYPLKRTARVWALTAEPPAQLSRQVRGLARIINV